MRTETITTTMTCRYCGKSFQMVGKGMFGEMTSSWCEVYAGFHAIFHHPNKVTLKQFWGHIKRCFVFLLVTLITLVYAVSFVFYPLYAALRWWFGD